MQRQPGPQLAACGRASGSRRRRVLAGAGAPRRPGSAQAAPLPLPAAPHRSVSVRLPRIWHSTSSGRDEMVAAMSLGQACSRELFLFVQVVGPIASSPLSIMPGRSLLAAAMQRRSSTQPSSSPVLMLYCVHVQFVEWRQPLITSAICVAAASGAVSCQSLLQPWKCCSRRSAAVSNQGHTVAHCGTC